MAGIIDGKNIEESSMPLNRLAGQIPSGNDLATLQTNIQNEEDARISADSVLQTNINNITDDYVSKTGSVTETITGAKTFNDTTAFVNDVAIQGNLNVGGSTTTVNSQDLLVTDNIITLNNGETADHVSIGTAGIEINRGSGTKYRILFDDTSDTVKAGFEGSEEELALKSYVTNEITNNPPLNPETIVTGVASVTAQTNELTTVTSITNQNFTVTLGALRSGYANLYTVSFLDGTLSSLTVDPGSTGLTVKYLDNALPTPVARSVYILTVIVTGTIAIVTGSLAA